MATAISDADYERLTPGEKLEYCAAAAKGEPWVPPWKRPRRNWVAPSDDEMRRDDLAGRPHRTRSGDPSRP